MLSKGITITVKPIENGTKVKVQVDILRENDELSISGKIIELSEDATIDRLDFISEEVGKIFHDAVAFQLEDHDHQED